MWRHVPTRWQLSCYYTLLRWHTTAKLGGVLRDACNWVCNDWHMSCKMRVPTRCIWWLQEKTAYICKTLTFKGALDNFSLIPQFCFPQKSWDFYTIRSVYLCSDCMLNLTCNSNLITKTWGFLAAAIFKSILLKIATSVMTVEFGTIHHYSSREEISEAYLCSFFEQIQKLTLGLCRPKLWDFGLEQLAKLKM